MAINITINGSVTLDESAGLQTGGVATSTEDNNDSDVSLATLPALFANRLFVGGLGLSNVFATAVGIAHSAGNYISLSGSGSVVSLGFTTSSGTALPVYGGVDPGAACNLTALDGGTIVLFADPVIGNRVVYGVDTDGDIVFALYMDVAANLLSASVWMVQFEALDNPIDTNHDDPLALTGLGVGAGVSTAFDFNALPSGQNLFGTVGSTSSGLIVFGIDTDLKADGTFTNKSDTINTSQGGGPTTIGVDNQMFDPGDGAYFTFVKNPVPNYLAGAPGGLDQNEADDADNMQYTGGTIESDGGFVQISQIQGNSLASMTIEAFNITGSPQGRDLITASGQNHVDLVRIKVYNASGTLIEDTGNLGTYNSPTVSVSFSGGIATVNGLGAGYKVEFLTANSSIKFDQVKIVGTVGKFDIGGFGVNEATAVSAPLTGLRWEDDGPTVDLALNGSASLTVDETTLPDDATITFANLFSTNTASYGTDGAGTDGSVYELVLLDPNSNLFDTLTGDEVIMTINAAGTLITGRVDDGGLKTVFTIEIDPVTEDITLTQYRALINGDPTDPDEADTPLMLDPDTIHIRRTLTDGDDDTASDEVDISAIFKFEDDGPSLPPATQDVLELVTDDTDLTPDTDTLSTDDIFTGAPTYGNDGPNQIDPIVYSLRLAGLDPDPDSGLVDTATGRAILLKKVGAEIIGYVDTNGDGTLQAGETTMAIKYSLSGNNPLDPDTEIVTFTQYRAVVHDDPLDPDEATSPETINGGLVFIDQTAIDGDGDVSNVVSFDLGAVTQIRDDGPAIGPILNGIVDFAAGDSVTNDLNGVVGKDPNATPYKITSYTASLTVNGVDLHGILSNNDTRVTYWADSGGNGTFGDAGDTAYYRLDLGDQGGSGDYTFTVLINPPPAVTPFDFTDLPSGQNLFGCIAANKSNLDGLALLVFSQNADVNNPGNGEMTNSSGTVNTSKGGGPVTIGDSNQMYDPGEGAYFVYLSNPDDDMVAGVPGGLTQNSADDADTIGFAGTQETRSASVEIVQTQGKALATINIKCFDIDMSLFGAGGVNTDAEARNFVENPENYDALVNVTAVRVYNSSGTLLESWEDSDLNGVYELVTNSASINVVFHETSLGSGIYYATVSGINQGYTIEFDTETGHDMSLIEGVSGKYDIGGFNILQGNDTPDQLLEFTAQVTDGDGDYGSASWKIGIDGTGIYDDNMVSGVII